MQFEHLRSLFSAHKTPIAISEPIVSFSVAAQTSKPYIEPDFEKVIFKSERPAVILISAVGATGKTTLAERLYAASGLPLLNLAKHKPVGDNSLTGVLTQAFSPAVIGQVIDGLKGGSFGLVIDGIDEGRSMTSAKAFEAFLDDIARLCGHDCGQTKVLMLGRTQILDETFVYLDDHSVSVGLATISPFGVSQATAYIDAYTGVTSGPFAKQYREARDTILKKLGNVFGNGGKTKGDDFLAFIGYPPVLDAIVTLLKEEKNYHKLIEELGEPKGSIVEIALLHRIAQYVMTRERVHKVLPNIVATILEDAPPRVSTAGCQRVLCFRASPTAALLHHESSDFLAAISRTGAGRTV